MTPLRRRTPAEPETESPRRFGAATAAGAARARRESGVLPKPVAPDSTRELPAIPAADPDGRPAPLDGERRGDVDDVRGEEVTAEPVVDERRRPPFRGPLESALRHPLLVVLPMLALAGAGMLLGLNRDPEYTSEARVSVGRVDVPAYTLQGVIIGNATLAASYARAIDAEAVVTPAANAVGISPEEARARLSASPIPESTLIRVEATGPSEQEAVDLANAGSRALINYVVRLNRQQDSSGLLSEYRRARAREERARTRVEQLQGQDNPNEEALADARVDLGTAQLRAAAAGERYRATEGGPETENLLQLISPAAAADSDRDSVLWRLILIGAGAGLLVGLALALVRENRRLLGRTAA